MKSNIEECPLAEAEEYLEGFMKDYVSSFGLYVGDVIWNGAHPTVYRAFENLAVGVKIKNPSPNVMLVFGRWAMEERFSELELDRAKKEIFE
jgi:hypothetical protein